MPMTSHSANARSVPFHARRALDEERDRDELAAAVRHGAAEECEVDEKERRDFVDPHHRRRVEDRARHRAGEHEEHLGGEHDVQHRDDDGVDRLQPARSGDAEIDGRLGGQGGCDGDRHGVEQRASRGPTSSDAVPSSRVQHLGVAR